MKKNPRKMKRLATMASLCVAGGTLMQGNCFNAVASLPICGGILTFCTPNDQLNVLFPLLTTPDFDADPTCTIPLGCGGMNTGGGQFFDPEGTRPPGGQQPEEPQDESHGIVGGAGGGGGGGI